MHSIVVGGTAAGARLLVQAELLVAEGRRQPVVAQPAALAALAAAVQAEPAPQPIEPVANVESGPKPVEAAPENPTTVPQPSAAANTPTAAPEPAPVPSTTVETLEPVVVETPAPPVAAAAAVNGRLQATLWEAASIVAQAAVVRPPAVEPEPAPVPVRLAAETKRAPAAPLIPPVAGTNGTPQPPFAAPAIPTSQTSWVAVGTAPAPAPASGPAQAAAPVAAAAPPHNPGHTIPALIAAARGGFDRSHLLIFGGTAAFLGVIWAAIWLAAGK